MADKITQKELREMARPPWIRAQGKTEVTSQGKDFNINVDRSPGVYHRGSVLLFKVETIEPDYLTGKLYNIASSTTIANSFGVWKPPHLQRRLWDGETVAFENGISITYTYTSGSDYNNYARRTASTTVSGDTWTITQEITPDYYVGEVLNIGYSTFQDTPAGGTEAYFYYDLNTGAKGWGNVEGNVS